MSFLRRTTDRYASVSTRKPLARADELVVEDVEDEVLVYDGKNARAHALTPAAARIWRACDGETSIDDLAVKLELPRDTVVTALGELEGAELLESFGLSIVSGNGNGNGNGLTRREMAIRSAKVGAAAAAAPMLYSIAVPSPAAAATPTNFACELFSLKDCGDSAGSGSIKGCCCCCESSSQSPSPACKVGASINGCSAFTCPSGTAGKCTGAPGSQPLTAGGCCGESTTIPNSCGCVWGRAVGQNGVTNGCPATWPPASNQQSVTCCDTTLSSPGNFHACTSASIAAGTCSACCCNGQVITSASPFGCCNNASATCCSDPSTCA